MYSLPYFKDKDHAEVVGFMHAHPFVTLCGVNAKREPIATQVPVLIKQYDEQLVLEGHFMKNTDHHIAFTENPSTLAIFTGANTYISASWYTNKQVASTWNYMSVHARGTMKILEEAELFRILKETTDHFENNNNSPSGYDHLDVGYIKQLSKAIVAFAIPVVHIDHVFKLSQNHTVANRTSIMEHLEKMDGDAREIAEQMKRRN